MGEWLNYNTSIAWNMTQEWKELLIQDIFPARISTQLHWVKKHQSGKENTLGVARGSGREWDGYKRTSETFGVMELFCILAVVVVTCANTAQRQTAVV